jgi:hypothetical protein
LRGTGEWEQKKANRKRARRFVRGQTFIGFSFLEAVVG